MAKLSKGDTSSKSEVHPDAWSRFERAVDVVAKSPPQHRSQKKPVKDRRQRVKRQKTKGT
jgi:hypothetical protein